MKFSTAAALLVGTCAATQIHKAPAAKANVQTKEEPNSQDDHLAQLMTSALAGAPPGEINEPEHADTDVEDQEQETQGHTRNYTFHWKYACAFTKWTPTNQFLHAATNGGDQYDPVTMTLERFGFIGQSKKCFWGMTGVFWVTPLKIEQIVPTPATLNATPPVEEHQATMMPPGTSLQFECTQYFDAGNPNDWHVVKITHVDGDNYTWNNKAGVSWGLTASVKNDRGQPTEFAVGDDCPYYESASYTTAAATYTADGVLVSVAGPYNEIYNHVSHWTRDDMTM